MPPSSWAVSSCVWWQEGGLILGAQADPGRSLLLFDSGPVSGAPGGVVFLSEPAPGNCFSFLQDPRRGLCSPWEQCHGQILIPGELLRAPPPL